MTTFSEQLRLLLWKNWILRKRHKVRLFMEFVWPLILFIVLWWVRTRGLKENHSNCHVVEKALPSVGGFELVQNYFCTLNNTCYDDYVENGGNSIWNNSLISTIVNDITPILEEILSTRSSTRTVRAMWDDFNSFLKVLSAFSTTQRPRNSAGSVKLKSIMGNYEQKAFIELVSTYTSLATSDARKILDSQINLDRVDIASLREVTDFFNASLCSNRTEFRIMTFPDPMVVKNICELDPEEKRMLMFFLFRSLNATDLYNKVTGKEEMSRFIQKESVRVLQYDFGTMSSLSKLYAALSPVLNRVMQFSGLEGSTFGAALIFDGLCGVRPRGNSSLGFDPGSVNRFDSLRDQLQDWNPDHHYENDPEISATCNSIFKNLESEAYTALLWRQIKPIIRGFIYYAPVTNFTEKIMKGVDSRFEQIREMEDDIKAVVRIIHNVRNWTTNHELEINETLAALSDETTFDNFVGLLRLNISVADKTRIIEAARRLASVDRKAILDQMDFVAEVLAGAFGCIRFNKTVGFETEWEAVNEGSTLLSSDQLWAAVIFENVKTANGTPVEPHHVRYKIRMDSDKVDSTRPTRDRLTSKTPRRRPAFDLKYFVHGFIYIQEMVEHSIIETVSEKSFPSFMTFMQQFPYPCYVVDQFIRAVSRTFPLFMVLSWVYASSMIVKSIVMEKELRLREVMKVMGLENGVIWCGWFIDSFVVMAFSATVLTGILKYGKVVEHSDVTLIWVLMMSYTITTIIFSFLMSTLFEKANSAAAAGGILFFVSYLPYNMLLIWEEKLAFFHVVTGCLLSNVAFGFGCTYLARYEGDGIGAQWDRITFRTLPGDDFNLAYCILMLWVDALIYGTLTWYIEAVFPGAAGVPKPWNFFLKRSYWCGRERELTKADITYQSVPDINCVTEDGFSPAVIEPEPEGLIPGVVVSNLSKTYSNGKVALQDLSITFYEDQITSFLGHNGAGKTTTISILTGLFPATSGTASIYGLNINTDMDSIRRYTGICPQYNTLFDRLNVEEHMKFYAGLKGKCDKSFEGEFVQMLSDLGIPHKRYDYPGNLSGGMKRKLSVACSFIGGSKVVFLDEPTSGVDPYSRRSIWELLMKYKQGRTIILTTHFMDEADILSERIAILSSGQLKACGSSLFLKSKFGQGYSLRLVKEDPLQPSIITGQNGSTTPHGDDNVSNQTSVSRSGMNNGKHMETLRRFIKKEIPEATILDDVGSEVVFLLPYSAIANFPSLFQKLDDNSEHLRISSYGISDTQLEDVFLKITIDDVEGNTESFNDMDGKCKRRVMSIFNQMKSRFKRKRTPSVRPVETTSRQHTVSIIPEPIMIEGIGIPNNLSIPQETNNIIPLEDDGDLLNMPLSSEENGSSSPAASLLEGGNLLDDFPARSSLKAYSSCGLAMLQIGMIILKRLLNSSRSKKAMFFEIVLPAVFIAITLAFTLILPPAMDEAPRNLTPWTYPSPNVVFLSDKYNLNHTDDVHPLSQFLNGLLGPQFMGTPCVTDELNLGICKPEKWSNSTLYDFNEMRDKYIPEPFPNCSCPSGTLECPASINHVRPPYIGTTTNDALYDVSKINIPEWIVKTYRIYEPRRYGGFELQIRDRPLNYPSDFLRLLDQLVELLVQATANFTNNSNSVNITTSTSTTLAPVFNSSISQLPVLKVWFDNKGWVSSVSYLNAMNNIFLRETLSADKNKPDYGITLTTHPMNLTKSQASKESLKTAGIGVIHAICVIFALSFVPASFTVYLIDERKIGAKHLHLVSGVKPITYWVANFIYDLAKYAVPVCLCIILFTLFEANAYIGPPSVFAFICLLSFYGWASIPAMYPFSFMFSVPSTAFVVLACGNLFIGVLTTISTFVLEQFGDAELERIGDILKEVFLIFPHYCLGRGLMELVRIYIIELTVEKLGGQAELKNRFEWDALGKMLFFLALQGWIFFAINLCLEYRHLCYFLFKKKRPPFPNEAEDEDVKKERDRVMNNPDLQSSLRVENLTRFYSRRLHPAVNGLTFTVEKGECFGLLGVNGAGKSSCFKMLTGDVKITYGRAVICDANVETNLDEARRHFGYCPQEDALDPLLNAYEILRLYGRLRGMTADETDLAVRKLIQTLGLVRSARRLSSTYSGGNRRKLSTAIALIGDPDIVFLDEPTSGMDPGARRRFWKVILRLVRLGKSVVLTSHSMEECEALCSRIGLMVNGEYKCLGSLQHLKNRFGDGYTVIVRCAKDVQRDLLSKIESVLPSARLEDHHCSQLKLSIPQHDAKLNEIFNIMHCLREDGLIDDYSVSQTTLDDIFVKFASQQRDDMDR